MKMTGKLEKNLYNVKYTAGSYLDSGLSLYLSSLEKGYDIKDSLLGGDNFSISNRSWDSIKEYTPGYNLREKLRDSLDTKPGMLFLQSNAIATIPFFAVGMPAAELAQVGIDKMMPNAHEITGYVTNSVSTLGAQMITGYGTFMANEVRTNIHKYVNDQGRLSPKKIATGLGRAVKAFLSFDIPYTLTKISGQSLFLHKGNDPWAASALVDGIALPAFWSVVIPLGIRNRVIETKQTKEWDSQTKPQK